MKHLLIVHLIIVVVTTNLAAQQAALKEQAFPEIKAKMLIPEGWFTKGESEDGVTVYQISREKAESEDDVFSAGLILSVTKQSAGPRIHATKRIRQRPALFSPGGRGTDPSWKEPRKDPFNAFGSNTQSKATTATSR